MKKIIFLKQKGGHYKEYADLIQILCNSTFEIQNKFQIFSFVSAKKYIIIDGDTKYLLLGFLSFFRSLLGLKTYFFSVRTEWIAKKSPLSFIVIFMLKLISLQKNTKYISIHKNNKSVTRIDNKYGLNIDYIYDPQLWDMSYLYPNHQFVEIKEIARNIHESNKPILSIIGSLNDKRCSRELLSSLNLISKEYHILIAGKHDLDMVAHMKNNQNNNISFVSKYLDIEEIFWIYKVSDLIYSYYDLSVKRPSGILGRGLQFNKKILVKKHGFLEGYFKGAVDMLSVQSLLDITEKNKESEIKSYLNKFNSSKDLLKILGEY